MTLVSTPPAPWRSPAPLAFSAALHASLILLVVWCAGAPVRVADEDAIPVEIVAADALVPPPAPPVPEREQPSAAERATPAPAAPASPPSPAASQWRRADHVASTRALTDPRNLKAKKALQALQPHDRDQQLCNFEALLQIGAANPTLNPEFVAPAATGDADVGDLAVNAPGAAVFSNGRWFRLAYRCALARDRSVAEFSFRLGEAIPRGEWEADGLPARQTAMER